MNRLDFFYFGVHMDLRKQTHIFPQNCSCRKMSLQETDLLPPKVKETRRLTGFWSTSHGKPMVNSPLIKALFLWGDGIGGCTLRFPMISGAFQFFFTFICTLRTNSHWLIRIVLFVDSYLLVGIFLLFMMMFWFIFLWIVWCFVAYWIHLLYY